MEAFICNECGLSRYGKYEFSIVAKHDFAIERVNSEKMREDLEGILVHAQNKYNHLQRFLKSSDKRDSIAVQAKMLNNAEGVNPISDIQTLFSDAMVQYNGMMKNLENAKSLRKELLEMEAQARGDMKFNDNETDDIFNSDIHMDSEAKGYDNDSEEFSGCFG